MHKAPPVIVFTDLDGTLLDHETYDYTPAMPMVERLSALDIPIVPVTSKTLAELELLNFPFDPPIRVAENGMARILDGSLQIADKSYVDILTFLSDLPDGLRDQITGFYDMTVEEVMAHTGLNHDHAQAAQKRDASEPFLWAGDEEEMQQLKAIADEAGFQITQGGRFYHVISHGAKDQAIADILNTYATTPVSIALGDGPNDAEMLAVADYGVVIPNPHGKTISVDNPKGRIVEAPLAGPAGWAASLSIILDELEQSR